VPPALRTGKCPLPSALARTLCFLYCLVPCPPKPRVGFTRLCLCFKPCVPTACRVHSLVPVFQPRLACWVEKTLFEKLLSVHIGEVCM
jgi:hypothetical protein